MVSKTEEYRKRQREYNRKWYQKNHDRAKAMKRERMREYRAANPAKHRALTNAAKRKRRQKLFAMYGSSCALCGFSDIRALSLDHIKGNGADERRAIGEFRVLSHALQEHRPDEFRVLCMNCQMIHRKRCNQW